MNAPLPKTVSGGSCGCSGGGGGSQGCACGGKGCEACAGQVYVRPRFFAGQLLTEDDLQTLTDYVTNKNRLHNRHLMGAGVVCGLEVSCNPCGGGSVVVHPGYALDCCGNDIVLQCATQLDINAMVRTLRRDLLGGYDCGDPCPPKPAAPKDQRVELENERRRSIIPPDEARQYCLYVRYCEEATEPVTPYAADEPCGAASCEPSRIREGLRFELRCREDDKAPDGFIFRALKCFGDLTGAERLAVTISDLDGTSTAEELTEAKQGLLAKLDRTPGLADCALRADVSAIALPAPGATDAKAAEKLQYAWARLVRDCICRAINPPCAPCEDPGVLLACLEVRDCEVVDICNLERDFVFTAVAFRYWVPIDLLGDALERMCCAKLEPPEEEKPPAPPPQGTVTVPPPAPVPAARMSAPPPAAPPPAAPIDKGPQDTQPFSTTMMSHVALPALGRTGLTLDDAKRLRTVLGSIGKVAGQGAFDRIVPVSAMMSAALPRKGLSEMAAERIRTDAKLRESVDAIVAERVSKDLATVKADSAKNLAAVKAESAKEIAAVKADSTKVIAAMKSESAKEIAAARADSTKVIAAMKSESAKEIAAARADSTKAISSEVDKRVKEALPADQIKAFTAATKELQTLKTRYDTLEKKYTALETKVTRNGGPR